MKYINSLLFLSYPLFVIAGNGGFIKVPFDVKKGAGVRTSPIINKEQMKDVQDTVDVDLTSRATFYSVNLNIGSNGDSVEVLLDTGSSDLWVVGADNEDCQVNGGPNDCNQYGTFDEQNSTSWTTNQQVFSIKYADNTTAQGYYGQDKIDFGDGMVLSTGTFAVANQSNDTFGVFGIGFEANEATANKYTNIPSSLKTEGLINKVAYSLYINSENATTGSILFGGIDNAKYQDDLVPINIVQNNGEYSKMQIHLSSIKVCLNNSCSDVANSPSNSLSSSSSVSSSSLSFSSDEDGVVDTANAPFMIDSGSTYCDFPSQIITSIADQAAPGYQYSQALGGNEVPCSLKDDGNSLQLTFDNKKMIEVPFKDLILDKTNPSTGAPACILKLGYSDYSVLGLDFLKHAYTVFNLDDKTISLAQMIYTQDENISAIE
ncbi:predicted protein [Scheffersomyces stipitis CBS 6054]|uniref:candidapepsin n=1 Tax=Scheffersomyces stipitis (strain ATCC 58785 / CBS 6054 / NBRC 10063 / NRRL Y-11545) TaxID=322104 RepID=A3LY70_PICST|nr:predicted protein [Scheffersomyces stipitis CBS 6054]ABN67928.2 predicted protein [Scheffersomyces stipitis CBS 6054]